MIEVVRMEEEKEIKRIVVCTIPKEGEFARCDIYEGEKLIESKKVEKRRLNEIWV